MASLIFNLILAFACFQVVLGQACNLVEIPVGVESQTFNDTTPGGTIIELFAFTGGLGVTPTAFFDVGYEYEAEYFDAAFHYGSTGTYNLALTATDRFSDFLDVERVIAADFRPHVKYTCTDAASALDLPANWNMQLLDTNNQAPQFVAVEEYITVDAFTTGDSINANNFTVMDQDYTAAFATVDTLTATWTEDADTRIVEIIQRDEAPTLEGNQYLTNFHLTLAENVAPGNYSIRLDVTDEADNRGEALIHVYVSSAMQHAGTMLTIACFSFMSAILAHH